MSTIFYSRGHQGLTLHLARLVVVVKYQYLGGTKAPVFCIFCPKLGKSLKSTNKHCQGTTETYMHAEEKKDKELIG